MPLLESTNIIKTTPILRSSFDRLVDTILVNQKVFVDRDHCNHGPLLVNLTLYLFLVRRNAVLVDLELLAALEDRFAITSLVFTIEFQTTPCYKPFSSFNINKNYLF
jgi:hypothetical protein